MALSPAAAIKAWEMDTLAAPKLEREAQMRLEAQRTIRVEEVVADYLQTLRELGLPKPVPAGTRFNSPDHAICPRDARGCASDAAIRKWFEIAGVLPKDAPRQKKERGGGQRSGKKHDAPTLQEGSGAGVAGTNLVASDRIPRSMALEAIRSYLRAVVMEAPEKLTPRVLKSMVADMPREVLQGARRRTVAETLDDIKAKIARIGVATVGHRAPGLVKAYDEVDARRNQAAARAYNPEVDTWLKVGVVLGASRKILFCENQPRSVDPASTLLVVQSDSI